MATMHQTFLSCFWLSKKLLFAFLLPSGVVLCFPPLKAQNSQNEIVVSAIIVNNDTLPFIQLPEVFVWGFESDRDLRRFQRLIYNVKKVYPYARLAGIKLKEYEAQLAAARTDRERKQLMRRAEKEIKEQYEGELMQLTFTQGKILIKLIDRQTNETSYALLQDLRGEFAAVFYQAFARIWGYNLKTRYDPEGEDAAIEMIVRMIENGQL